MYKFPGVLLFLCIISQLVIAQSFPKEGDTLNYRRIGFSFPVSGAVIKYKIAIASGNYSNEDSFKKNVVCSFNSKTSRTIAEVPSFGSMYTWQSVYTYKNASVTKSPLHHFSTGYIPNVDSCNMRLRILQAAIKYKDDFVFVDGNNVLYDMKGNPVWYFPIEDEKHSDISLVRDLKLSPQSTITFLLNQHAYEINYNGNILWKGPDDGKVSGEDSERYHHEFTRLANGHYMVLGTEHLSWNHKIATDSGKSFIDWRTASDTGISNGKKTPFGTVIEYDEQGNVVWSWKSSKYIMASDVVNYQPGDRAKVIDVHENAFFFDAQDSVVYVSFRNLSRILKVKYPEGDVTRSYGEIFKPGIPSEGNGLFCDQHACRRSKKGYLYLYNNNACNDEKALPKVIMMKEPRSENDSLKIVWEYECNIDDLNLNPLLKKARAQRKMMIKKKMSTDSWKGTLLHFTSGGNVIELPDESIFVCMNTQYSKIFIVSQDKKILWSATPEKWNKGNDQWYLTPQLYRASIITRKELDRLIWNGQ